MRQHRRIAFAAPFVIVVTAACGGAKTPVHDNPPDPKRGALNAEACKLIQPGERCETNGERCDSDPDCPTGFDCVDGKWQERKVACNPPPPSN